MRQNFMLVLALVLTACSPSQPLDSKLLESATAKRLENARGNPAQLLRFLHDMPKGGDLHNHLAGAIYAESLIGWATDEGLCFSVITFALAPPPCSRLPTNFPIAKLQSDSELKEQVIDAWSMRNWKPGKESGHDHFFHTFDKYLLATGPKMGEMLAEVTTRAATEHVSYIELMITPDEGSIIPMGAKSAWSASPAKMRKQLDDAGLSDSLKVTSRALDKAEARRRELQHCGATDAGRGCDVTVRYLYQVLRGLPKPIVFTQILAGFEWVGLDPRVVGVNLVMPEDDKVPMQDFDLHMTILDSLHTMFPNVPVTLHAGELTQALVPPNGFGSHIRKSITIGHARRIGHGVDLMQEERPDQLLVDMAKAHVLVEIALTSNRLILGMSGPEHPLAKYLSAGVPVALSTDDEGVSRSDMTHEFLAAVEDQKLDYLTLKKMVRNSLEYAFVSGDVKTKLQADLEAAFLEFERKN